MSVVEALQLTYPDNSPVVPIVGSPEQFNPYVSAGSLRPWYVGGLYSQGDASGGTYRFTWEYRPAADDRPVFVTVTQMFVTTGDSTAQTVTLASAGDPWERPLFERIELDVQAPYYMNNHVVTASNPVTLGKGATGSALQLHTTFEANTNSQYYLMFATGFVSDRPFLTSRNVLPL